MIEQIVSFGASTVYLLVRFTILLVSLAMFAGAFWSSLTLVGSVDRVSRGEAYTVAVFLLFSSLGLVGTYLTVVVL